MPIRTVPGCGIHACTCRLSEARGAMDPLRTSAPTKGAALSVVSSAMREAARYSARAYSMDAVRSRVYSNPCVGDTFRRLISMGRSAGLQERGPGQRRRRLTAHGLVRTRS